MATAGVHSSALHLKWRYFKDRLARYGVAIGGLGVIAAVLLIFFYLFYVVIPLFLPAEIKAREAVAQPGTAAATLYAALEEQAEVAFRLASDGSMLFYEVDGGKVRERLQLQLPPDSRLTRAVPVKRTEGLLAVATDRGEILIIKQEYRISYPDDVRLITPDISYPYGRQWLPLAAPQESGADEPVAAGTNRLDDIASASADSARTAQVRGIELLAIRENEDRLLVAATLSDGSLRLLPIVKSSDLFATEITLEPVELMDLGAPFAIDFLIMDPLMDWLYAASRDGRLAFYNIGDLEEGPQLQNVIQLTEAGRELTALAMLAGGISLVAGDTHGNLSQWFPVRGENNVYSFNKVRSFEPLSRAPVTAIEVESARRGFAVTDNAGRVGIYYGTSGRQVLTHDSGAQQLSSLAMAPRSDLLIAETAQGRVLPFELHNEHPEVSWSALWGKVWYESYPEPDFVWQSSSASDDHEPKFSLVPLSFGTLKAAFYAMLFAMPLAIMGAIYTAYFMAPEMRQMVKPTIEVMEALPTVILGFLAGLWLAPMVENNLPGVFSLLILMPVVMVAFGYAWTFLPARLRHSVPDGWHAAIMVPVIIVFGWICFELSRPLELWLFDGNLPYWMDRTLGIDYDQRNALVVGLAMGFAVIPTIFSIAEDAIFSVPRHLSNGSLALGATPWQTLVRVVLPTASPGIFSSVMIGMGRAVGETMIVLMATGNTPVMDMSPFQGMRTLSANIAVEMPEAEVDSTHYRILFLAGLVLFLFTFILNTMAELVRQRLREKYTAL